jgi:uncharacterized protein (TIGR03067 family)
MIRRFALILVLAVFMAGPTLYGGDAAKEKEALQGNWKVIDITLEGKKGADLSPHLLKGQLTITGDRMKLNFGDKKETLKEFSFELNPTKNPKHIDLVALNGMFVGDKGLGLYKLDKDTLTLVMGNKKETPRPKSFEAPAKSGLILLILKKSSEK